MDTVVNQEIGLLEELRHSRFPLPDGGFPIRGKRRANRHDSARRFAKTGKLHRPSSLADDARTITSEVASVPFGVKNMR